MLLEELLKENNIILDKWKIHGIKLIQNKVNIETNHLKSFNKENLEKYYESLFLFSLEKSENWSKGLHQLLELGFKLGKEKSFKPKMKLYYKKQLN